MSKKYHFTLVGITYFMGVGSSIYFFGKLLNKIIGFDFGQILIILIQILAFYSLTKLEKYIKEDAINKYISHPRNHDLIQ